MRTRAGITIRSWHTRRPRGTRSGLRIRARRLACSTLPTMRVVVGMVSAGLSSPNRSIGCAQVGVDFMGSACRAGFASCIASSARAGVVARGGRRPGTRCAPEVCKFLRGEKTIGRRDNCNFIAKTPTRCRFIYGTLTAQIYRLVTFAVHRRELSVLPHCASVDHQRWALRKRRWRRPAASRS